MCIQEKTLRTPFQRYCGHVEICCELFSFGGFQKDLQTARKMLANYIGLRKLKTGLDDRTKRFEGYDNRARKF